MVEKRQFMRHDAIHLLDYVVLDENGNMGTYSMGRTLDVSVSGLKLETNHAFPPGTALQITLGLENDLVDITGTVTHCKAMREDAFVSGISFDKMLEHHARVLKIYVDAFNERKAQHK